MEAKWGLIPDMGATLALRELVPRDVAIELTTTGRIFRAEEAKDLGLVTRVVPAGEHLASALATAKQIAAGSPDAAAAAKRLWHAAYDAPTDASADRRMLLLETELQKRLMGGWNQLACTVRGLGAPPALQPGFYARDDAWSQEADDEAERVAALLG
ncbi:delta-3,5-delta-2,4-dienoyl-CoA isomerase [Aureococcus anophagefferens]|nr:delta-3,5-delta-2,4-dienoyl-CoA isomerase [Aureococcus anophagefferens]